MNRGLTICGFPLRLKADNASGGGKIGGWRPTGGRKGETVKAAVCSSLVVTTLAVALAAGGASAASPARVGEPSTAPGFAEQLQMAARATPAGCTKATKGHARCYLKLLPDPSARAQVETDVKKCKVNGGYTPCNIEKAYGLKSLSASNGSGQTIAVVDAYDDPNAESDLDTFRSTYGLPACTTANGCFEKVNEDGQQSNYPSGNTDWGSEISTDLDMVSSICPNCHIILVEADSSGLSDLLQSIDEAVTLGATVVSDSWGTTEFDGENSYDSYLDHPGVAITFSSGDGAYQGGVQYPSASPYVTSVGGTMLKVKDNTRGWKETAWVTKPSGGGTPTQGSGSGCSGYEAKPSWQTDSGCSNRMTADVSAVASNVVIYDTYESGGGGWYTAYGTSVSSPIIAGVYALAGNASSATVPASIPYAHTSDLYDITKGSEGTCTPAYFCEAGPGYDGPTGLGSPDGDGAF